MLYYRGNQAIGQLEAIAISGSRQASFDSLRAVAILIEHLPNYCYLSGMALGIDQTAHRAALKYAATVAVLPCGFDYYAPSDVDSRNLRDAISQQGMLLSSFSPTTPARPVHYLQRDRLLVNLADCLVAFPTGLRGTTGNLTGTCYTISQAILQAKPVYVFARLLTAEVRTYFGSNLIITEGREFIKQQQVGSGITLQSRLTARGTTL